MPKFNFKYIQILSFLLFSCAVTAAAKDYQIELIVFKYNDTNDMQQESWPLVELKNTKNAIILKDPQAKLPIDVDANIVRSQEKYTDFDYELMDNQEAEKKLTSTKYYNLLSASQIRHKAIANKIHDNSRYSVLSHIGWRQPQSDLLKAKTVKFQTGKVYNLLAAKMSESTLENSENILSSDLTAQITGTIKLSLKKFVHADMNLLLNLPAKTLNNKQQPFELISQDIESIDTSGNTYLHPFLISENRRMKDDRPNYFDHPVFGAILVVNELKS